MAVQERRRAPRYPVEATVRIEAIRASGQTVALQPARVENVSEGGVFVSTNASIPPGLLTNFTLVLKDGEEETNLLGIVRWRKEGVGLGLEFFFASDEERQRVRRQLEEITAGRQALD